MIDGTTLGRIARAVPRPLLWPVRLVVFSLAHQGYEHELRRPVDATAYWRGRAAASGRGEEGLVMWSNPDYMRLFRERQRAILERHVALLPRGARVLDVCCGIGTMSRMLRDMRPDLRIDAIDYPGMVEKAASTGDNRGITYVGAAAEEYFVGEGVYHLALSSASYASITDPGRLRRALANGFAMTRRDGGTVAMIDAFHRWNYLARGRAKLAPREVERLAGEAGFRLVERGDLLFWPFRDWYSNSGLSGERLERRFELGERLLGLLGPRLWSDYKVLVFRAT